MAAPTQSEPAQDCDWPQWGQAVQRDFSYPCETDLAVDTAADLQPIWFFNSRDTVTATPAVVGSTLYVGDWSGNFYALDTKTGKPRWRYKAPLHGQVYAGQIVSSAAVAEVDGVRHRLLRQRQDDVRPAHQGREGALALRDRTAR